MIGISVGDAFKAIELLFKGLDVYVTADKRLFTDHIDPCFKELEAVHNHYLTVLSEIEGWQLDRDGIRELRVHANGRVRFNQTTRDYLKEIAAAWKKATTSRRVPDEVLSFFREVESYFNIAAFLEAGELSNYGGSLFLHLRRNISAWEELNEKAMQTTTEAEAADTSAEEMRKRISRLAADLFRTYDRHLTSAWRSVSASHARAKIALLR